MLKFVRYRTGERSGYGLLKDDLVFGIEGSIFERYELTSFSCPVNDLRLLPPLEPSKIICVGLNYPDHAKEINKKVPRFPSHFMKPPSAVTGPDDPILIPPSFDFISYEGELAVVIGRKAKDVSQEKAMDYVLGYTCLNDITVRSLIDQCGNDQLVRAKGYDTFAPFGPCVATKLNPAELAVRTFLNGEIVQNGRCGDMIFSVPYLVHYLSQCMTFYPGDIISTGTPPGIRPIKPGDVMEVRIDGIGTLRNTVQTLP